MANLKDIDYDVFADDTIHLISSLLKLKSFVLVGSNMQVRLFWLSHGALMSENTAK